MGRLSFPQIQPPVARWAAGMPGSRRENHVCETNAGQRGSSLVAPDLRALQRLFAAVAPVPGKLRHRQTPATSARGPSLRPGAGGADM